MRTFVGFLIFLNLPMTCVSLFAVKKAEQRISVLEDELREEKTKALLSQKQPSPLQHHYRFERNGASLWRYDESTGESCQIESNVTDNWVGGKCPN